VGGLVVVAFAAFALISPGGETLTEAVADVVQTIVAAGAAVTCMLAGHHLKGRTRRSWRLIGASAASWAVGQAIWTGYELAGHPAPFPSPSDAGYLLAVPLMVVGLLTLPATARTERTRRLADGLVVGGSVLAVIWVVVLGHVLDMQGAPLETALALAYPVSDAVLIGVVISLIAQSGGAWRRPLVLIGAGLLCITVADGAFAYLTATDSFRTGSLVDLGWVAGYVVIAWAGLEARKPSSKAAPASERSPVWLVNLPYVPAAAMVVVLALASATQDRVDGPATAIGATVLLLLLGRQVLVNSANVALAGRLDRQRSILLSVLHSLGEGVVVADEGGNLVLFNDEAHRVAGSDMLAARWLGARPAVPMFHLDGRPFTEDELPMVLAIAGEQTDVEMRLVRPDELGERILSVTGRPVRDQDGRLRGGVVVLRDETERRRSEAALRETAAQLAAAQELALVGSWEIDLATGTSHWSDQQYRMLDYEPGSITPRAGLLLEHVHPDDMAAVQTAMAKGYSGDGHFFYRCRVITATGRERWMDVHGHVVGEDGVPRRVTGMAQDVTDRVDAEAALRRQATEDTLTRLPNRGQLAGALSDRLERRRSGEGVALLLMDLDRFKEVNDSLGHEVGDRVLVEVAERLRQTVRTTDLVTRLGGDEFAIVVSDLADDAAAGTVAANLIHVLERPVEIDGITVPLGASVGIAYAPVHGEDSAVLLQKADVAMYRAKHGGLGWAIYGPADDEDRLSRLALIADLRGALDRGEIVVHYQPQVDLRTGRTHVVEALARWNHPELGMVPPGQFIPLAEQTGLIRPLTIQVMRQALAQCKRWRSEGIEVGVAVNLSPRSLVDPGLVSAIHSALREAEMPASMLTLEITESAFADSTTEVVRRLEDLRDLGVRLCIDDFGTGYSSMAYLKNLPVDELKIDRAFVFEMDSDSRDIAIVRAIVELAHSLGLSVVAEGVESDAAGRMLTALRCDVAQGYGLCRPAAASAITGWLVAREAEQTTAPYADSAARF
jgi:diguanylate cyclase (GGDEF)-like protein/PAS domain S-box-containing protein